MVMVQGTVMYMQGKGSMDRVPVKDPSSESKIDSDSQDYPLAIIKSNFHLINYNE